MTITSRRQARLPLTGEVKVRSDVFVGVQNIALARVDIQVDQRRIAVLNLYGVRDIDAMIAALQSARATLVAEKDALEAYLKEHPEAVLPS